MVKSPNVFGLLIKHDKDPILRPKKKKIGAFSPNLTCITLNIADKRPHSENEKCEAPSVVTGSRWPHC